MTNQTKIREIFNSIQGEGPYVGEKQLFVRFCICNLNCAYCDTDFDVSKSKDYTVAELVDAINSEVETYTISLTGGEPLCSTAFLKEFLPEIKKYGHKIYLETNATLPDALLQIIDYVDIVSADIKLKSASGMDIEQEVYDKFFAIASKKDCFAKVVFNGSIRADEIGFCTMLAEKYKFLLVLQPEMDGINFAVSPDVCRQIFDRFYSAYQNVRLIPQVHKFINLP